MIFLKSEQRTQSRSFRQSRWRRTSSSAAAWSFLPSSQLAPLYWVKYHAHRQSHINRQSSSRKGWKRHNLNNIRSDQDGTFYLSFFSFRALRQKQICMLSSLCVVVSRLARAFSCLLIKRKKNSWYLLVFLDGAVLSLNNSRWDRVSINLTLR